MIKLILMNGAETEITFPCREKDLYDWLGKIDIPELIPPIVYVKEVVEPKEYAGLARKAQNLDEINYFAKTEEDFSFYEQEKLKAVVSAEKEITPKRLINLCFNMERYSLHRESEGRNGIKTEYGIVCVDENIQEIEAYHGKTFPYCSPDGEESPLLIAKIEYGAQSEYVAMPCDPIVIAKSLHRLGAYNAEECTCSLDGVGNSVQPMAEIFKELLHEENIHRVNEFIEKLDGMQIDMSTLADFVTYAGQIKPKAILKLAEHIEEFGYIGEVFDYAELGSHIMSQYLPNNLPEEYRECIDYERIGEIFAETCGGSFVNGGFGYMNEGKSLEDILSDTGIEWEGIK